MRVAICYYSATGNTKTACERAARRLGADLFDVIGEREIDLAPYDLVGLAAPADFGGMPKRFETFLEGLPDQGGKPAFVMNTYGFASGRILRDLAEAAGARGFSVVGAHSLHTPENYPPMIAIGLGSPAQPKSGVIRAFDAFVDGLPAAVAERADDPAAARPVRLGWMSALSPKQARTKARDDMGVKSVDVALCTECGTCAKGCPYGAIALAPKPVFDEARCYGCWRCYNRCPRTAIRTARFHGPYYPGPNVDMERRLSDGTSA